MQTYINMDLPQGALRVLGRVLVGSPQRLARALPLALLGTYSNPLPVLKTQDFRCRLL